MSYASVWVLLWLFPALPPPIRSPSCFLLNWLKVTATELPLLGGNKRMAVLCVDQLVQTRVGLGSRGFRPRLNPLHRVNWGDMWSSAKSLLATLHARGPAREICHHDAGMSGKSHCNDYAWWSESAEQEYHSTRLLCLSQNFFLQAFILQRGLQSESSSRARGRKSHHQPCLEY